LIIDFDDVRIGGHDDQIFGIFCKFQVNDFIIVSGDVLGIVVLLIIIKTDILLGTDEY
jgi:hypothetical protein